ncbi:MAG: ECF transporter S component [Candidatus Bathyarchaeota archaeon]|nr:ECF transporter S component [Candidatus Bathyarchaeota archaeon]
MNSPKTNYKRHEQSAAFKIATAAIFTALVFVVTSQIPPIPIPATGGYFNVGETTIYVAALVFGPLVGAFAGGVGAALSDVYLGYSFFAPGTLAIKAIEGAIVGFLNIKLKKYVHNHTLCAIIAVLVGGLSMVLGYFLYENLLAVLMPSLNIYAIGEIPLNIGQMLVGLIIAVPIMHAILRFFPQLKSQI